jgi:hypothetical protein
MRSPTFIRIAAVLLAAGPVAAPCQSVDALQRRVAERAAGNAQGVNNFAVELTGQQAKVTLYTFRRSGTSPFEVQFAASGMLGPSKTYLAYAEEFLLMFQERRIRPRSRARFTYGGVSEVGGTPVHVVTAPKPGRRAGSNTSVTLFYDTTTLLPRRVRWVIEDTEIAVDYEDYRPVDGMPVAFRRRSVMRGLRATLSDEELARLRLLVQGARAEMAQQSEAERAEALRGIEEMERFLDHDELLAEMTVTSAVINQGLPQGVPLRRLWPPIDMR